MKRPLEDLRPLGPFVAAEERPKPEPPEAGRTGRYTEEELLEFMDRAYNHPWTIEQARGSFEGLTNLDPEASPKTVNLMRVSAAAGLIGSDSIDARRDTEEVVDFYIEERNIEVP